MKTRSALCCTLIACSWLIVGCDATDDHADGVASIQRSYAYSDPERGVWINNGLEDPSVSGIDPAFALDSSQGIVADESLLPGTDRYATAQYLVECALPEDASVTKVVDGEVLTFDGTLGLAPEWEQGACDEDCQEWVSACLLARTNVSGQTVTVWMQADHPAIGMESSLQYSQYEASFFGNLFAEEPSLNLCQGVVVGPLLAQLQGRTCSNVVGESCAFTTYTGCELESRCTFESIALGLLGPLAAPTALDCEDDERSFHTISTYVSL